MVTSGKFDRHQTQRRHGNFWKAPYLAISTTRGLDMHQGDAACFRPTWIWSLSGQGRPAEVLPPDAGQF